MTRPSASYLTGPRIAPDAITGAESAADLLCTGDLSLVKKCQHDACILYFYDTTKNHARQWCSMELCGNRMKAAMHYRRKKRGG